MTVRLHVQVEKVIHSTLRVHVDRYETPLGEPYRMNLFRKTYEGQGDFNVSTSSLQRQSRRSNWLLGPLMQTLSSSRHC